MSDATERHGHCLCGDIRITAKSPANKVCACHFGMCRRWGGGPFMEIDCGTDVSFDGEENISVFSSSPWAERGFCKKCGSHLFYRIKETGQHMMPVGLFDDSDGLVFTDQVFIDEKPAFYRFAGETQNMTGAELLALYGSSE